MSKYGRFIFKNYDFDESSKTLTLTYSLDNELSFTETFRFDFEFAHEFKSEALDKALQTLFFIAGVSYYKTYLPKSIVIEAGEVSKEDAQFFSDTYQKGLGEMFFVNNLDPNTSIVFSSNSSSQNAPQIGSGEGLLVGVGGGKDSLVSVELLRNQPKVATWSVNHRSQLEPLVAKIGLPHFWVERQWDKKLLELNQKDALNGHVPISAILSAVGTIVALLSGYRDVVVSNESSANEPTLEYEGVSINHQYSKSSEYEQAFQQYLGRHFDNSLRYYSFLRPLTEVYIAELFSRIGFEKYKAVFSSCNRAFTHNQHSLFWCGVCSKCAFVFLALTPFIKREELEKLWSKNLLLDPKLAKTYKQLLGIAGDKPLDCVGEVKESRAAMRLAQKQYPELNKYKFSIPEEYDYHTLSPHNMPAELFKLLSTALVD